MNRSGRVRDVIVTTTGSPVVGSVSKYCGLVSAHVVAGTGLFSDIGASFSDVFGGRSKTYQKQLSAITDEALAILKERANELKANYVVGARIDHDEISGGSKSMFMVTASGTAVFVDLPEEQRDEPQTEVISHDELLSSREQAKIHAWLDKDPVQITDANWNLIIKHAYADAANTVTRVFDSSEAAENEYVGRETRNTVRRYFETIDPAAAGASALHCTCKNRACFRP